MRSVDINSESLSFILGIFGVLRLSVKTILMIGWVMTDSNENDDDDDDDDVVVIQTCAGELTTARL